MTGPGDDIDARVRRLEREVAQLRERLAEASGDAAAARVLASGADRDVSKVRAELRAHLRALNALRETQLEQGLRLHSLDAKVNQLDAKVDQLDVRVGELGTEMREGFSVVNTGMAQISALLATIARDEQE
ncbi:MAG: hypothetical protein L0H64_23625 [Pseudonocardia sp.]|nr:hypothetical protein [Pseudonocardia sp.]